MRTLIKSLTLSLGVLAATAANAQVKYFTELGTGYSKPAAGAGLGTSVYLSGTQKFNDNLSGTVEFINNLTYIKEGDSKLGVSHGAIRIPVTRSNLNWIGGGWKTAFTTRWTLPTGAGTHKVGGWGAVLLRPAFSKEAGAFSIALRPQLSILLTDSAKQKFVTPGNTCDDPVTKKKILCTAAGNTLVNGALEILPAYTLAEGWDLGGAFIFKKGYKGAAQGKDAGLSPASFSWDVELGLPVKAGSASFAVSVGEEDLALKGLKAFTKEGLGYNFYIRSEF